MGILLTDTTAVADPFMGTVGFIIIIAVYAVVFWFFFMRPQNKEKKRLASMISALEAGDCVMTTSGFYGVVIDISDDTVIVEFGNNKNCRIPMDKSAISRVEKPEN